MAFVPISVEENLSNVIYIRNGNWQQQQQKNILIKEYIELPLSQGFQTETPLNFLNIFQEYF